MTLTKRIADFFPLWALLFSLMALAWPGFFAGGQLAIIPLLGVVMFGMGATLTSADFAPVIRKPGLIAIGLALQYGVMPLAGWIIARAMGFGPEMTAGIIIVGSCPGGTASNVVTYLARGDVALSITLTFCSTLLAVALTPILTLLYAGARIDVPAAAMTWSVFEIVILPVAAGVMVNSFWGQRLERVRGFLPALSVLAIVAIISIIVGLNAGSLANTAAPVAVAVVLHNFVGLMAGFWVSWIIGLNPVVCRTLAIEVGMQNSGLGVALALKYFGAAAALPAAFFSVWHNLSGSFIAAYWARKK
ncbi:MAG: bile acid:sodium symporter family protein [Nitrospinota bacterium]|nr:bile acid:sodium symporter family protein [Nitrospinota bacterium]